MSKKHRKLRLTSIGRGYLEVSSQSGMTFEYIAANGKKKGTLVITSTRISYTPSGPGIEVGGSQTKSKDWKKIIEFIEEK